MKMLHRSVLACGLALAVAGCATPPSSAVRVGETLTFEGRVVRIDTAPWAYDGNATVTVDTMTAGEVGVALPARWNLCKAPAPDVEHLAVGDRVRATGQATDPRTIVVCDRPEHRLVRVD